MTDVWYCTREEVKGALDYKETARNNAQVDRAISSASRSIEGLLNRKFYPTVGVRYKNWPNSQYARTWRLWLDEDEVISVSSLASAGNVVGASDYFLEPANDGPPYTYIELDLDSDAAFGGASTHQRSVAITGVFGYRADSTTAGLLAEALDSSETDVTVTNSAIIGIGDLIKVEDERMVVTGKSMITSGQNLQTQLAASNANDLVAVVTGSSYNVGEIILIDSERMLIIDIAGNNLVVKRAWDGSTLAAHNSATTIYVSRVLTVERGVLGTTAATHSDTTPITKHVVPGLVKQLCIAEAINYLLQESSGFARAIRSDDTAGRDFYGKGLQTLRDQAYTTYGRRARIMAV